jgi:hypothetical protein
MPGTLFIPVNITAQMDIVLSAELSYDLEAVWEHLYIYAGYNLASNTFQTLFVLLGSNIQWAMRRLPSYQSVGGSHYPFHYNSSIYWQLGGLKQALKTFKSLTRRNISSI